MDAPLHDPYPRGVSETLYKIRDLLLFEVSRRRGLQIGPRKRPNARALARILGVHPTTVQHILRAERNVTDPEVAQDYQPSPQLEQGLMRLLGLSPGGFGFLDARAHLSLTGSLHSCILWGMEGPT